MIKSTKTYKLIDGYKSKFEEYINSKVTQLPDLQTLPFIHTKSAMEAKKVFNKKALKPVRCDVFKKGKILHEKLSYFFYGRSAYRVVCKNQKHLNAYFPVCYIFKSEIVEIMNKAFVFDSGAYATNRYSEYLVEGTEDYDINEYSMPNTIAFTKRILSWYYESNEAYCESCFPTITYTGILHSTIQSYHNIITAPDPDRFDDRCRTFEFITRSSVDLDNNLEAVILPLSFLRKYPKIHQFLKENNINIISYNHNSDNPESYNEIVAKSLYGYLFHKTPYKSRVI